MNPTMTKRLALARACSPLALALSLAAAPAFAQTVAQTATPQNLDLGAVLSTGANSTGNLQNTPAPRRTRRPPSPR